MEVLKEWRDVFLSLLALLGVGGIARLQWNRRKSADGALRAADRASESQSQAETKYYNDIVERLTNESARWQDLYESECGSLRQRLDNERDRWNVLLEGERRNLAHLRAEVVALTGELRHTKSNYAQRIRFLRHRHPELDLAVLDSGPMPLAPSPHPATRRTDPPKDSGPDSNLANLDD